MDQPPAQSREANLFAQLDQKFAAILGADSLAYAKEQAARFDEYKRFLEAEKDSIKGLVESQAKQIVAKPRAMAMPHAGAVANAAAAPTAAITTEAYWWGFHIVIPEQALNDILSAQNIGNVIGGLLINGGPVAAGCPPMAILILGIAAAFGVEVAVIKAVDKGNGVYLSWCWLQVPALFAFPAGALPVPTPIT